MDDTPATHFTLAALIGLIGLAAAAWIGPSRLMEARATAGWLEVPTTVVEARVTSQSRRHGRLDWNVTVEHRYALDDVEYTGTRWSVNGPPSFEDHEDAERFARDYRAGDRLTALVDPGDPRTSLLVSGGTGEAFGVIAFGGALVVLSVWLAVRAQRRRRMPRSDERSR